MVYVRGQFGNTTLKTFITLNTSDIFGMRALFLNALTE